MVKTPLLPVHLSWSATASCAGQSSSLGDRVINCRVPSRRAYNPVPAALPAPSSHHDHNHNHDWPIPWLEYLTTAGGLPTLPKTRKGGKEARHHIIDVTSLLATLRTLTAHVCAVALDGRDGLDLGMHDKCEGVKVEVVIDAVYR